MRKPAAKKKTSKRRPVKNWSSTLNVQENIAARTTQVKQAEAAKPWRSKTYRLKLSYRTALVITVRKFKSKPTTKRSTQLKQFKLPIPLLPVKEITFAKKTLRVKKRPPKTYTIVIQRRMLALYALVAIGLAGTVLFGLQLSSHRSIPGPKTFSSIPTPQPKENYSNPIVLPRAVPTQLKIDKIGLDVKTVEVGRLADGSMETPNVLDFVTGWYKYSPTPGELGPAVIVGHVDSYKGISVFWRLRELAPGDDIDITRADGSTATFKVSALQQFDQNNFPTQAVYGNIPYAGLRLITCGGTFNTQTGHYDQNTVVFARLTGSGS